VLRYDEVPMRNVIAPGQHANYLLPRKVRASSRALKTFLKRLLPMFLSICVVSCTGGDSGPTALATSPGSDGDDVAEDQAIEAALGTRAVQDSVIYLDLASIGDDGAVSFYSDVLDQARSDDQGQMLLTGGFSFTPTDAIHDEIVDDAGDLLPGLPTFRAVQAELRYSDLILGDAPNTAPRRAVA
jgi:hypothetical protein